MSTAADSANIPIQEFRAKLQEAVDALRFEDDATVLTKMLSPFSGCMQDVFGSMMLTTLPNFLGARSLLIIAYIGRAIIDIESNELQLISENGNRKVLCSVIDELFLASKDDPIRIFRAGGKRAVQLLACCDEHSTVRSRPPGITFIQRFRAATYTLRNAGDLSVNVDCSFGELQRSKTPTAPDCYRSSSSLGFSISSGNDTNVLFKISLTGVLNDVILSDFLQLTKTIPLEFKATLENAYESNSVVVLCRASRETFARFRSTLAWPSLVRGEMPEKPSTRSFGDLLDNRQEGRDDV
ncbi:hypothetical protein V1522DRAFT_457923 [Lipomyces starkeyi]